jgi:hypothetical protein
MATEVVAAVAPSHGIAEDTLKNVSKSALLNVVRPLIRETAFEFGGRKRARAELTRALVANGMPALRKLKKERESLIDVVPDIKTLRAAMKKLNEAYTATKNTMNEASEPQKAALTEMNATVKYFKALRVDAMKDAGIYTEEYVMPDEVRVAISAENVEEAKVETEAAVREDTEKALSEGGGA